MSGFIENPFADPAITQVTSAPTAHVTIASTPQVTDATPQQQLPPTATTINMVDTKELERRQIELEIKAKELAAREEALRQAAQQDFQRQHNWPPLPAFCPFKPCFFQDINVDIQPEFQKTVQLGYNLWIGFVFTLIMNILGAIAVLIKGLEGAGETISFGIISFIFFVPLTYMTWFRPLYKAFKNDSSFNFMVFFLIFSVQTAITLWWSLGLQGSCGVFFALRSMGNGFLLTTFLFLVSGCWVVYVTASVLYLLKVHSIYRSTGASIAKARNEFSEGLVGNQFVRGAVAAAARQTVNQAFATGTNGSNNVNNQTSSGVRY